MNWQKKIKSPKTNPIAKNKSIFFILKISTNLNNNLVIKLLTLLIVSTIEGLNEYNKKEEWSNCFYSLIGGSISSLPKVVI